MVLLGVLATSAIAVTAFYLLFAIFHLVVIGVGAVELRRRSGKNHSKTRSPITVAIPAYNEEQTAVEAVSAVLNQSYPVSVVFIDDGSVDRTFEAVYGAFDLSPVTVTNQPADVELFEAQDEPLTVIRQENRGKSAALNRALEMCETPLFGVVDADTIIEPDTLPKLLAPLDNDEIVACEGSFRVGTPTTSKDESHLPASWVERNQAIEHLRALILRQLGRGRADLMVHVFGGYSAFRTELVRAVGGFAAVETEDFNLALALRRHCRETGRQCRFVHVPDAVAWTRVPPTPQAVADQRERWVRGTVQTVRNHGRVFGNPRYGLVGVLGVPYFLIGEIGWPMIEGLGYLVVPTAWLLGAVPSVVPIAFLAGLLAAGPIASVLAVLATRGTDVGYDSKDRRTLLKTAAGERLWRPVQVSVGSYSVVDYLRR